MATFGLGSAMRRGQEQKGCSCSEFLHTERYQGLSILLQDAGIDRHTEFVLPCQAVSTLHVDLQGKVYFMWTS